MKRRVQMVMFIDGTNLRSAVNEQKRLTNICTLLKQRMGDFFNLPQ